jgi:hypothetical protein
MNEPAHVAEMQALCTRAAEQEARRQAAAARGDRDATREAELEISRLWARYLDLERQTP